MIPGGIHDTRIEPLNRRDVAQGRYVLYWMQQSQRADWNHALELAVQEANRLGQGVVVVFGLMDDYPEANLRHFTFMLEGLQETSWILQKRGIRMIIRSGSPPEVALEVGQDASLIICDRGYLRHQKVWRQKVAQQAACKVVQVESDLVVPVAAASPKAEIGARTLRQKIHRSLFGYLQPISTTRLLSPNVPLQFDGTPLSEIDGVIRALRIDRSVPGVSNIFKGGSSQAKRRFRSFLKNRLKNYARHHNQPQTDDVSCMSPYLHFGQISPVYMAREVLKAPVSQAAKEAFLEQMIVRRELACNYAHYTPEYDSYTAIPAWARKSLQAHLSDRRPYIYSAEELAAAATHDPYWNAAMREMICTGFMHNHMRMYWGKKILEWSRTPEEGFASTLALNNKYFLDGRDPNSYAGVGWIYGLHDRAWPQRPVYGKVRCMTRSGLERKCDIKAYIRKVDQLSRRACPPPIGAHPASP